MAVAKDKIFEVGQKLRFNVETKNKAGVLTDPTTLVFRIKPPVAIEFTKVFPADAEVVKDAVGQFHIEFTLAEEGEHPVRWEANGAIQNSTEDRISARDGAFN